MKPTIKFKNELLKFVTYYSIKGYSIYASKNGDFFKVSNNTEEITPIDVNDISITKLGGSPGQIILSLFNDGKMMKYQYIGFIDGNKRNISIDNLVYSKYKFNSANKLIHFDKLPDMRYIPNSLDFYCTKDGKVYRYIGNDYYYELTNIHVNIRMINGYTKYITKSSIINLVWN